MRIGEIKRLFPELKCKIIISRLWDIDDYKKALGRYDNEPCTVHDIYDVIVSVFLGLLDRSSEDIDEDTIKSQKRDIKTLSKMIYGEAYYWTIGTEYYRQHQQRKQKIVEREKRVEQLAPLYKKLSLSKGKSKDVIEIIAKDEELCAKIMESSDKVASRMDLFQICQEVLVPRIKSGEYHYRDYWIMNSTSYLAFRSRENWAKLNNLSFEKVASKFMKNTEEEEKE